MIRTAEPALLNTANMMTYTVVLLNGTELENLSIDQVKTLFFGRQINQNSLVRSGAGPAWQMLKRAFDLTQWLPDASKNMLQSAPRQPSYQANAFNPIGENLNPAPSPSNAAQFDPGTVGHTQNNQSQTFYQAETLPAEGKFQNIRSNYTATDGSYQTPTYVTYETRAGHKAGAVFIGINVLTYVALILIVTAGSDVSPENLGQAVGRAFIPIIIDLTLASRLWNDNNAEKTRKWALARAYFGFVLGLAIPFAANGPGEIAVGIAFGVVGFFYLLAIGLVLHGKEQPSNGRIYAGVGSFAVFFLISVAIIGLAGLGKALPVLAKMQLNSKQIEKYKIDGTQYHDKTTGAKVDIPKDWVMVSPSNPIVNTPTARMIAVDKSGERITLFEVVPVPAQLDMKRQQPDAILDQLCDGVVKSMQKEAESGSVFGRPIVKEMSRMMTYVGKHPAKLLIVEKTERGQQVKGHVIITYDELTFYVLHSWCPTNQYASSQDDFLFFEKNFTVPDNINSTFTQTAENERRK
jgi:hypothetical protein